MAATKQFLLSILSLISMQPIVAAAPCEHPQCNMTCIDHSHSRCRTVWMDLKKLWFLTLSTSTVIKHVLHIVFGNNVTTSRSKNINTAINIRQYKMSNTYISKEGAKISVESSVLFFTTDSYFVLSNWCLRLPFQSFQTPSLEISSPSIWNQYRIFISGELSFLNIFLIDLQVAKFYYPYFYTCLSHSSNFHPV